MKALLTNGTIVTLQKDCECQTHDGPHWLHMDAMYRASNRALLAKGTFLAVHGFMIEDSARCKEKLRQFKQHGIAKLLPETEAERLASC